MNAVNVLPKVYKNKGAAAVAKKAAEKKNPIELVVVPVDGGFILKPVVAELPKPKVKNKGLKPNVFKKAVDAYNARKTNPFVVKVAAYIAANFGEVREAVVKEEGKVVNLYVNGQKAFWFHKQERANAVLSYITK